MTFEFEYHDGEFWRPVGVAEARGLRRPFDEALNALSQLRGRLPLGVYRVRLSVETRWHVGELSYSGDFDFDDERIVSLGR